MSFSEHVTVFFCFEFGRKNLGFNISQKLPRLHLDNATNKMIFDFLQVSSLVSFVLLLLGTVSGQSADPVYVAYFTSWSIYARQFSPAEIPADKLTHINYAFAKIVNGQIALADEYADTQKFYRKLP